MQIKLFFYEMLRSKKAELSQEKFLKLSWAKAILFKKKTLTTVFCINAVNSLLSRSKPKADYTKCSWNKTGYSVFYTFLVLLISRTQKTLLM